MSDLAAFLLARIAEDEDGARAATPGPWATQTMAGNLVYGNPKRGTFVCSTGSFYERTLDDAAHIARQHPARVLAECEAKRQIVQRALDVIASFGDWDAEAAKTEGGRVLWPDVNRRERSHAHDTLHTLAIPYAAHPDYREDWRP